MGARVQIVGGNPDNSPTKNQAIASAAGIRVAWLYMRPVPVEHGPRPVWGVSAFATGDSGDFDGTPGTPILFTLSPSRLLLPPLGAASMIALAAFVPARPSFSAITFSFYTDKDPDAKADVWAFADTSPHTLCGLSTCPLLAVGQPPFVLER